MEAYFKKKVLWREKSKCTLCEEVLQQFQWIFAAVKDDSRNFREKTKDP